MAIIDEIFKQARPAQEASPSGQLVQSPVGGGAIYGPPAPPNLSGQVLGSQSQQYGPFPSEFQSSQPVGPQQVSAPAPQPQQNTSSQNRDNSKENALIDEAFNAINDYLGRAASTFQGQLPSVLQAAEDAYSQGKTALDTGLERGKEALSQQEIEANQRRVNADNATRRLYSELARRNVQLFGGATSAGQGLTDLLGVEAQRSSAQTAQQFGTAMREIDTARQQLDQDYQNELVKLEQWKFAEQSRIKQEFDASMLEIERMRAEAGQNKANMRLQALQNLRNEMFAIEQQERQFQQSLSMNRQALQGQLNAAQADIGDRIGQSQAKLDLFNFQPSTEFGDVLTADERGALDYVGQKSDDDEGLDLISQIERGFGLTPTQ